MFGGFLSNTDGINVLMESGTTFNDTDCNA